MNGAEKQLLTELDSVVVVVVVVVVEVVGEEE